MNHICSEKSSHFNRTNRHAQPIKIAVTFGIIFIHTSPNKTFREFDSWYRCFANKKLTSRAVEGQFLFSRITS